jgi:hypothetical protein
MIMYYIVLLQTKILTKQLMDPVMLDIIIYAVTQHKCCWESLVSIHNTSLMSP